MITILPTLPRRSLHSGDTNHMFILSILYHRSRGLQIASPPIPLHLHTLMGQKHSLGTGFFPGKELTKEGFSPQGSIV